MPVAQEQGGSAINDLRGIARLLLDDNYNFEEQDQMAAEQALGGGFGRARRGLMRDSEKKARWAQATPILQGIAGMAQQAGLQTQSENAALKRDAENGRMAMERQNAVTQGQLVAQTQAEAAQDKRDIAQGQRAERILELQGAQADRRQAAGFAANIEDREDTQLFNAGESSAERAFRLQQQYVGGTSGRNSYTGPSAPSPTKPGSALDGITNPTMSFLDDWIRRTGAITLGPDGRGTLNLPKNPGSSGISPDPYEFEFDDERSMQQPAWGGYGVGSDKPFDEEAELNSLLGINQGNQGWVTGTGQVGQQSAAQPGWGTVLANPESAKGANYSFLDSDFDWFNL